MSTTDYNAIRATRIAAASHDVMRARQGKYTCHADPLNPCWDGRPTDIIGKHWGGGDACANCNARALTGRALGADTTTVTL